MQEDLVRLAAWMPFEKASEQLRRFRGTQVSRSTAERLTEAAGAAYVAVQEAEVVRIEDCEARCTSGVANACATAAKGDTSIATRSSASGRPSTPRKARPFAGRQPHKRSGRRGMTIEGFGLKLLEHYFSFSFKVIHPKRVTRTHNV